MSFLLGNLLLEYGNRVSLNDILQMVLHGDTYSRTAIRALGTLYDYFPDHIAAFGLAKIFAESELIELVYYCELREKYLGINSMDLIHGNYDYTIGNRTLDIEDKSWLMNKWANRGDAVFVDYLVIK